MTLVVTFRSAARSEFDEAAKARIESCGAGRGFRCRHQSGCFACGGTCAALSRHSPEHPARAGAAISLQRVLCRRSAARCRAFGVSFEPQYVDLAAARLSPDALAMSLMPRARAMSPRMAANNAGSFASRMSQTRGDCRFAAESRRRVELRRGFDRGHRCNVVDWLHRVNGRGMLDEASLGGAPTMGFGGLCSRSCSHQRFQAGHC